jgi:hypothetical protein
MKDEVEHVEQRVRVPCLLTPCRHIPFLFPYHSPFLWFLSALSASLSGS